MGKKSRHGKPRKIRKSRNETPVDPATGEDRRAEAVTVAWMLSMLATTAAGILAAIMFALLPRVYAEADPQIGMSPLVFSRLLLLTAAVTGAICVSLTPLVYRFRNDPPPIQITAFGLVVSVGAVVTLFWTTMQR